MAFRSRICAAAFIRPRRTNALWRIWMMKGKRKVWKIYRETRSCLGRLIAATVLRVMACAAEALVMTEYMKAMEPLLIALRLPTLEDL